MLSGVDLRVRRMETRASTLPTFRESSDCGLSTCWPAKVELLIADAVAMIFNTNKLPHTLPCNPLPVFLFLPHVLATIEYPRATRDDDDDDNGNCDTKQCKSTRRQLQRHTTYHTILTLPSNPNYLPTMSFPDPDPILTI